MSNQLLSLAFDILLAGLLLATIGYCARLSKRIHLLQDSKGELASMITHFDHATQRASNALNELQTVSKKITESLQVKIDKANFLADDLAFLIEKGTKIINQLEQARAKTAAPVAEKPAATPKEAVPIDTLEAMLQRLSSGTSYSYPADKEAATVSQPRTNAERELIHALKSGR